MKLYVELDAATSTKILSVSTYETDRCFNEVEADGTVDLSKLGGLKIVGVNGVNHLVYDEALYTASVKAESEAASLENARNTLETLMRYEFMQSVDDETALELRPLYPEFGPGALQTKGMKLQYNGKLYKVIAEEPFISTSEWTPDAAVALYAEISGIAGEEYPEYLQPNGANPYMDGDKVTFNGKKYICNADNTVWSPAETPDRWDEQPE